MLCHTPGFLAYRIHTTWSVCSGYCWAETELQWRTWWRSFNDHVDNLCLRTTAIWYQPFNIYCIIPGMPPQFYILTYIHPNNFMIFPSVLLLVVTSFINWNSVWWRDPGYHETMLGGKPVCAVSTHCCGCMAPLPLSTQPKAPQVKHTVFIYLATHTHFSGCLQP